MDALLLAVLNALWQGAALIALVALALRAGLRRNATTACVVWTITFGVVALLPALDLALARPAGPVAAPSSNARARGADFAPVRGAARESRSAYEPSSHFPLAAAPALAAGATFTRAAQPADALAAWRTAFVQRAGDAAMLLGGTATAVAHGWGIAIVAAWGLVAGGLLLRLAASYAAVARMKRDATPIEDSVIANRLRAAGHRRRASVARSGAVEIPCAIGFRNPMILVPERLASSLDAEDLARIVLHESAHLQRYDDWTNALEQIVCALQFFQPALHFARRSIDFEREVACDDRVLEDAGEPLRYAECLARIVQRHVRGRQAAVVPGFVLRRPQVVARVRRIVDRSRDASPRLRLGAAVLGAGVMVATLGIARLQVPVVAPASAAPAPSAATRTERSPAQHARDSEHARHAHQTLLADLQQKPAEPVPVASQEPAAPPAPAVSVKRATHVAPLPRTARVAPLPHVAPLPPLAKVVPFAHIAPARAICTCPERSAHPAAAPQPDVRANIVRTGPVYVVAPRAATLATGYSYHIASAAPATAEQSRLAAADAPARAESGDVQRASTTAVVLQKVRHTDGDLLDAIDEAKYPHPSVDELIALHNQGVTADYVRRMGALGRNRPSLHELLALAVQGVTPDYVATLDARLASPPTFDQVLALRIQGVRASWLDGMAAVGYPKLTTGDALSLAVQGVSTGYVRGLLDAGLRNVTPSQLVALRVQGVDGAFVRRLAEHGYRNMSVDELVRLKVNGFQP